MAKKFPGRVKNVNGDVVAEPGHLIHAGDSAYGSTLPYSFDISANLNMTTQGVPLDASATPIRFWTGIMPQNNSSALGARGAFSCGSWDRVSGGSIAGIGTIDASGVIVLHGGYNSCAGSTDQSAYVVCISSPAQ